MGRKPACFSFLADLATKTLKVLGQYINSVCQMGKVFIAEMTDLGADPALTTSNFLIERIELDAQGFHLLWQ